MRMPKSRGLNTVKFSIPNALWCGTEFRRTLPTGRSYLLESRIQGAGVQLPFPLCSQYSYSLASQLLVHLEGFQ